MALLEIAELGWRRIVQEYVNRISAFFGSRLVSFVASYDPNVTVDDYNVVVVLDRVSDEDRRSVLRMARSLEAELGVEIVLVPAVVERGSFLEEEAKNVFNKNKKLY